MATLRYTDLDQTSSYATLKGLGRLATVSLDRERVDAFDSAHAAGLRYNYAAKLCDERILKALGDLAEEQQCIEKYRALAEGAVMNTGENRMVLHHLLRGQLGASVVSQGRNLREFYEGEQKRINDFAARVHAGELRGSTGKEFEYVVQIGIGGSDLGPRALYIALEHYARQEGYGPKLAARFISNVDPDDAAAVLDSVDLEKSLFVLVTKSGTTQETLTNQQVVIERMKAQGNMDPRQHMIAVTSESSPLANSSDFLESFYIDDYIGGRYSGTSAVGTVMLSLAFGPQLTNELLAGAHDADLLALEPELTKNPVLLDALLGVYERNILGFPTTAILPYSQALSRFPAHLQQLDMESNGKRVNRDAREIGYSTGPIVFGEPGTNGQHSFYQLLHQGTEIVPLQFIGFRSSQRLEDVEFDRSTSQQKLNANVAAQIAAFAEGKHDENRNKHFPGGRPASLIYGDRLSPRSLGALLSHYENKVMFQGFLWNINSFDQEGVQLGKTLTKQVLSGGEMPSGLETLAGLLGV
jgi:glucose-6-phosphate isomerase